jgi:hypothetical protein
VGGSRREARASPFLHSPDVGVHRQHGLLECEAADGIGGVAPDAGKHSEIVRPAELVDDRRRPVEAHRAPVVTEALPGADHLAERRRRERPGCRPALQPSQVAWNHAVDLRLLEHHL